MVHICVNNSINININEFESVYNLKEIINQLTNININNQIIYYNGFLLTNDKLLKEYNITNNCNLYMNQALKGGFDTLSILMWLLYLCAFMFYLLILISGLIPVVAHTYGYLLDWAISKIGSFLGLGDNRYYKAFQYIIMFIISITIVYYFVYAMTAFIVFPIAYVRTDKLCKSIKSSNTVGFWVAIFFIIVYGLFNIPNFILNITYDVSNLNFIVGAILQPVLGILENFANIGKFAGIYAIPFVGTPFLEGYHFAVGLISTAVTEGVNLTTLFSCQDEKLRKKIGLALREATKKGSPLNDWIQSYDMQKITETIIIGLIPELYDNYKCKVDNMPFWEKFGLGFETINGESSSVVAGKFYTAKYATKGFCFALRFMQAIAGVLDSIGGSSQIANMIRTGNIGGVIAFIVFIVCLILVLFGII